MFTRMLTVGFIASTRTFNLLTRAFNPPTRASNLPTRAFNLATRAFSLLTRRFELVTREIELVTRGFELVTRGFELVTRILIFHTSGSYFVSDIQNYFKYILKIHDGKSDNPSLRIYLNEIENRIIFKIKRGYYLGLLMPETMKLLGTTKNKITKDENDENDPHLEITEVVLFYCNIVNNDYQHSSEVLHTFVPSNLFGQSLDVSPKNSIFSKTFN